MIGHQYPAVQKESGFLPELTQDLDERPAEALASEQPRAPVAAGSNKLQFASHEMASVNRHLSSLSVGVERNVRRRADLALRQPARTQAFGGSASCSGSALSYTGCC